ncbi:DUF1826 domain-containing protein [Tsuneonella sp. CC-YZS046]|uniref:DUF1826 domain-containing protein n=1 Tax=Tsuneonella sp. CC-YZS046 TaxID=3042152 RepID=UPI002D791D00|nr:DUF1826 domain-containing protein [Tsuneonella sp. CC-YZS046]WRO65500.1 DUF1826 domain-containing protein [Tsuneonella sp. CC-YZS046]
MVLTQLRKRAAGKEAHSLAGAATAVLASCPTALRQIHHRHTALAIWRRRLAGDVARELASLILDDVDDMIFASESGALEAALAGAMEQAGYPDMPALRADIAMLARQHAAITDDRHARIRLEVVETDSCRKFHADYVKVRTITTYLGRGTQWIEAESAEGALAPDGPGIEQVATGSVAMFKGRLWQENPTILHRSPPIGDSGEQRLVLVIDPAPAQDEMRIGSGRSCM